MEPQRIADTAQDDIDDDVTMIRCAYPLCECRVRSDTEFVRLGRYYCSTGCADGDGCAHRACDCSGA